MTYSRPSGREAAETVEEAQPRHVELPPGRLRGRERAARARAVTGWRTRRSCSTRLPCVLATTARAAVCSSTRSSAARPSPRTTNTSPRTDAAVVARARLRVAHERLQVLLHAGRIRHRLVVQQHEIDGEAFQVPVLVRGQQLAQQAAIVDVVDPREDDRPVAGNAEPPQPGDRQRVRLQRSLRWPQRGVVVQQAVRELLVKMRFAVVDAEVVQLHLRVRPGERRRALECRRIVVLVGEARGSPRASSATIVANATCDRFARRDAYAHAQARDRVEHGAGEVGERSRLGDGDRRVHGAPATDEARAVGLELDARRAVGGDHVRRVERAVGRRARPAREDEARRPAATNSLRTKRFENAGCARSAAGGVSVISAYDVISISRATRAEVAQRQPADFGVVLGRHDHFERRFDRAVLAHDADAIFVERDFVARRLGCRSAGTRPTTRGRRSRIAQIDEAAVIVAGRILAPARDADVAPVAVAGTRPRSSSPRSGRSTAIASMAAAGAASAGALRTRARPSSTIAASWSARGSAIDASRCRVSCSRMPDARISGSRWKYAAHRRVEQHVGERHERHALVVRHVGANERDRTRFGNALAREVERFVEAVAPACAQRFERARNSARPRAARTSTRDPSHTAR